MFEREEMLRKLQRQVARKHRLETMLSDLYARQGELRQQVAILEEARNREQADVERLEGHSLSAFFYGVVGKKDAQLSKEREEAYAAQVKYEAVAAQLFALESDIRKKEQELGSLFGCEERYEEILQEKIAWVKGSGGPTARRIMNLEQRITWLEGQQREIQEALAAGQRAMGTASGILSKLDSAHGWATWDLFGGGFISDMAKYSQLDQAQQAIQYLQADLQRFTTELSDVRINADLQVSMDGFMRFADYFFDNLFTDWMVMDHINRSLQQIQQVQMQISGVLVHLQELSGQVNRDTAAVRTELNQLLHQTGLGGC